MELHIFIGYMVKPILYFAAFSLTLFSCANDDAVASENTVVSASTGEQDSTLSQDIVAYKTVLNVVRESELMPNFTFVPGDVEKAKAYIANNERLLAYNPDFIEKLQKQALNDTNWTGISILAREISHHLAKHKLQGGVASDEENLDADKNAGFVLYKMGASLQDAVSALEESSKEDSVTQAPLFAVRKAALTEGWQEAKTLHAPLVKTPDKVAATAKKTMGNKKSKINMVEFHGSQRVVYKVIIAGDSLIYKVDAADQIFIDVKGRATIVGYKLLSNKLGFDWFFEKNNQRYGVDKSGRMWARSMEGEFKVIGQAIAQ